MRNFFGGLGGNRKSQDDDGGNTNNNNNNNNQQGSNQQQQQQGSSQQGNSNQNPNSGGGGSGVTNDALMPIERPAKDKLNEDQGFVQNQNYRSSNILASANLSSFQKREKGSPQGQGQGNYTSHRRNSQDTFATQQQTIVVLDWDDTLFPTTWVRHYMSINWRYPLEDQPINPVQKSKIKQALDELSCEVEDFLKLALTKSKVVIVTLAKIPWVNLSCDNFFPRIAKFIKEHQIKIVYAQEFEFSEVELPTPSADPASQEAYWIKKKQLAIQAQVRDFYSQYPGQSWKNVISIGDSDFERKATIATMTHYSQGSDLKPSRSGTSSGGINSNNAGNMLSTTKSNDSNNDMNGPDNMCLSGMVGNHYRRLRTKTIKMYDSPRIKDLELEIQLLKKWLPSLIGLDSGLDVDLEDDERLAETHRLLTGEVL